MKDCTGFTEFRFYKSNHIDSIWMVADIDGHRRSWVIERGVVSEIAPFYDRVIDWLDLSPITISRSVADTFAQGMSDSLHKDYLCYETLLRDLSNSVP